MSLLKKDAIGVEKGTNANALTAEYTKTPGFAMALNRTHEANLAAKPAAAAASPGGPGAPGGGGRPAARAPRTSSVPLDNAAIVPEHEVFKNNKDALAFFFYHQASLDGNAEEGPFWFRIEDNSSIIAGTEKHYAVFEDLTPAIIDTARQRGVIMLVEFENQQPFRCTPCYLSDSF